MTHEEVQKVLPWYANKQLDVETSRRVEMHLAACAVCRGDVEGLYAMLAVHEQALPGHPVDEKRLDALFARIDRHESERRAASQRAQRGDPAVGVFARIVQWLTVRPALVAGSLAAVVLTVFMAPLVLEPQAPQGQQFQVLSTKGADSARFLMRVQFRSAPSRAEVEQAVTASIGDVQSATYRIEQRSQTEYVVVFDSKPSVEVVSRVLSQLGDAPNVVEAAIDDGTSTR